MVRVFGIILDPEIDRVDRLSRSFADRRTDGRTDRQNTDCGITVL